jgi:hypothetical protein
LQDRPEDFRQHRKRSNTSKPTTMLSHRHRQRAVARLPQTTSCTPVTRLKILADQIGKGVEITPPPVDLRIAEGGFRYGDWKPDGTTRRTTRRTKGLASTMVRISPNYWTWPAGLSRPSFPS